jgi:hypothetical protein
MGSGGDLGLGGLVRLDPCMPVLLFCTLCSSSGLQVQSWTASNCNLPELLLVRLQSIVYGAVWHALIAPIAGPGWYEHGKP